MIRITILSWMLPLFWQLKAHSVVVAWIPQLPPTCRQTSLPGINSLQESLDVENDPVIKANVTILDRGQHYVVVAKPPSVVCHHSEWTGSRASRGVDGEPEVPMLQRVRDALGQRINLIHRLDRGASGCLLCTFASNDSTSEDKSTQVLIDAMTNANKTYVALVRGEGILHGEDLKQKGWFTVNRPIKDERGVLNNATTQFRFVAGQDNGNGTIDRPRASLVLARPKTGRWHQIRRHLNGLSHPILGDSTHGSSRENREWKRRGMPGERIMLHLAELQLPSTTACPEGIHVTCPLPDDMMEMLQIHLPRVWEEAQPILEQEGIVLSGEDPSLSAPSASTNNARKPNVPNFCSNCGAADMTLTIPPGDERLRATCTQCGHVVYENPRPVSSCVVTTDDNRILLAKRAIEPRKGTWGIPQGFMELGETSRAAAVREVREETGVVVFPDDLKFRAVYNVPGSVQLVYSVQVSSPETEKQIEAYCTKTGESSAVELVAREDLAKKELCFPTVQWALDHCLAQDSARTPHIQQMTKYYDADTDTWGEFEDEALQ